MWPEFSSFPIQCQSSGTYTVVTFPQSFLQGFLLCWFLVCFSMDSCICTEGKFLEMQMRNTLRVYSRGLKTGLSPLKYLASGQILQFLTFTCVLWSLLHDKIFFSKSFYSHSNALKYFSWGVHREMYIDMCTVCWVFTWLKDPFFFFTKNKM